MTLKDALNLSMKSAKDEIKKAIISMRRTAGRRMQIFNKDENADYRVFSEQYKRYGNMEKPKLANMTKTEMRTEYMRWYNFVTGKGSTVKGAKEIYEKVNTSLVKAGAPVSMMTAEDQRRMLGEFWKMVDRLGIRSRVQSATSSIGSPKALQEYIQMRVQSMNDLKRIGVQENAFELTEQMAADAFKKWLEDTEAELAKRGSALFRDTEPLQEDDDPPPDGWDDGINESDL